MWLIIPSLALALDRPPCLILRTGAPPGVPASPAPPEGKELRDALGSFENVATSENFALKWGDALVVTDDDATAMLDAFEAAWSVYVTEWGMDAPHGTDEYLFNVYVGNSGSPAPSISGAYGYYTLDRAGWPLIVMEPTLLGDASAVDAVAAHEFFHAIQDATGAFNGWADRWYWEAGATWAAGEALPDSRGAIAYLYAYLWQPYLPLTHDDDGVGGFDALHQYGAFIWLRYLQEYTDDPDIIRDGWMTAGAFDDPMDTLAEQLADQGRDIAWEFGAFAARNAVLDYERADLYHEVLTGQGGWGDDSLAASWSGTGSGGWVDAPDDLLPGPWAYATVALERPYSGTLHAGLSAATEGSDGTEGNWTGWLVVDADGGPRYHELDVDGRGEAALDLELDGTEEGVYLVAAVTTERVFDDERFAFSYRLELERDLADSDWEPDGVPEPAEPSHLCAATPGGGGLLAAALGLLAAARRRRR